MRHGRRLGRGGLAAVLTVALGFAASSMVDPAGANVSAQPAAARSAAAGAAAQDGRIVFADFNNGQIFTINPDGSALVQVTDLPPDQAAIDARWTPDSSGIVFSRNPAGDGDFRLFTMDADGSNMRRVMRERVGFSDFNPMFTPNGRKVVFTRCRPDPPGGCALFTVRADGTGRAPLTRFRRGIFQQADFDVAISPNGRRVAFTRFDHNGIRVQTWLVRMNGTHSHSITPPWREAGHPRWTPDGQHLLIHTNGSHLAENVFRIRSDGSDFTKLTSARFPHNDEFASASPSGQQVVFGSDRDYPDIIGNDLFVMAANGTGQHSIQTGRRIFSMDWGTAPLLSVRAATPNRLLSPSRPPASQLRTQRQTQPWRAWSERRF